MVGEAALARRRLEHRGLGLLCLEEERIVRVTPEQQHNPCARPDAADSDHLSRRMHVAVALDQVPAVSFEALRVRGQQARELHLDISVLRVRSQFLDRRDERWIADDSQATVHRPRQLGERAQAVLVLRLGQFALDLLQALFGHLRTEAPEKVTDVQARVPDVEVPHRPVARAIASR